MYLQMTQDGGVSGSGVPTLYSKYMVRKSATLSHILQIKAKKYD